MCDRRKKLEATVEYIPLAVEDECISPQICAKLVIELIKYVIYWRGQIPARVDQLQYFASTSSNEQVTRQSFAGPSLQVARQRAKTTRIRNWSASFAVLSKDLDTILGSAFPPRPPVRQVALLFGATPVSPKETHVFRMPSRFPTVSDAPADVRGLFAGVFKALVADTAAVDLPDLSPTNAFAAVQADGKFAAQGVGVLPHADLGFPRKGRVFVYDLSREGDGIGYGLEKTLRSEADGDGTKGPPVWYRLPNTLKGFV